MWIWSDASNFLMKILWKYLYYIQKKMYWGNKIHTSADVCWLSITVSASVCCGFHRKGLGLGDHHILIRVRLGYLDAHGWFAEHFKWNLLVNHVTIDHHKLSDINVWNQQHGVHVVNKTDKLSLNSWLHGAASGQRPSWNSAEQRTYGTDKKSAF